MLFTTIEKQMFG